MGVRSRGAFIGVVCGVALASGASADCDGHKAASAAQVVVTGPRASDQKVEIKVSGAPGQAVKVEAPEGYAVSATGGAGASGAAGKSAK